MELRSLSPGLCSHTQPSEDRQREHFTTGLIRRADDQGWVRDYRATNWHSHAGPSGGGRNGWEGLGLVEAEWLEAHLGDADLHVIDCGVDMLPAEGGGLRFVPAASAWQEAHVPGATFVDVNQDLPDRGHELQFMLPSAQRFSEVMSRHGVGEGTRVVLYDGFMNMWAARLWWMLRTCGFDNAAVLIGGWRVPVRPAGEMIVHQPHRGGNRRLHPAATGAIMSRCG